MLLHSVTYLWKKKLSKNYTELLELKQQCTRILCSSPIINDGRAKVKRHLYTKLMKENQAADATLSGQMDICKRITGAWYGETVDTRKINYYRRWLQMPS